MLISVSERIRKNQTLWSLLVISVVAILAYAPLMTQLGYYKEDWYMIWAGTARGSTSLVEMFMADRPLHGYWYAFLFTFLEESAFAWHIFALVIRVLCGFIFLWLLRLLWPEMGIETTMAAVLATIYPGFIQQAQAIGFQGHFIALLAALLSVTLTVYAHKFRAGWRRWLIEILAIILLAVYPLLLEYYIGFEGVRLLLIGYLILQSQPADRKNLIKKSFLKWIPYLTTISGFVFWRLFVFSGERRTTDVDVLVGAYTSNPVLMLPRIVVEFGRDFIETVYLAWSVPLNNFFYQGSFKDVLLGWGIAVLAAILVGFYLRFASKSDRDSTGLRQMIWIGLLMAGITLVPAILANRDVEFVGREDRFSLPASLGVGLLLVGLIFRFLEKRSRSFILLSLVWISVLTQINFALWMRDFWEFEQNIWWQVAWRAPQFQEGTVLLLDQPAEKMIIEDYEVWTPANIIYHPQSPLPVISGEMLFDPSVMHEVIRGADKPFVYRRIPVERDFRKSLVISMPSFRSCLNFIDGTKPEISMLEEAIVHMAAPYSRIDLIESEGAFTQPPESIFGPEPPHTWCYYYQKASYARQIGDWDEVARLGDEAREAGYGPYDYYEWMPFFEAYANLGRTAEAKNLAKIIKTEFGARNQICRGLEAGLDYPEDYQYDLIMELLCR